MSTSRRIGIEKDRYAEAEDILATPTSSSSEGATSQSAPRHLSYASGADDVVKRSRRTAHDRSPTESVKVATGDSVELRVGVSGDGPWAFNGSETVTWLGATHHDLRSRSIRKRTLEVITWKFGRSGRTTWSQSRAGGACRRETVGSARGLRWEVFKNIPGSKVGDLTQAVKFPFQPDSTEIIDSLRDSAQQWRQLWRQSHGSDLAARYGGVCILSDF